MVLSCCDSKSDGGEERSESELNSERLGSVLADLFVERDERDVMGDFGEEDFANALMSLTALDLVDLMLVTFICLLAVLDETSRYQSCKLKVQ